MAAEIVVSASTGVMKPLLNKLTKLMGDEYKDLKGVRKEVVSLNDELTTMHAFLEKMEDADNLDPLAKDWKNHVREMAYDMEDCIDNFMLQVDACGTKLKEGILWKAARRLRTLRARHRIANQIQELKNRARGTSERRMRYKLDECTPSSSSSMALDPRLTALYTEPANLVGVDGPKEELIELILDHKQQLKVVSIVGFGGLGKTTLANLVYRQIGGEFECRAFVSVSQPFDVIGLLDSMSSQLGRHNYSCFRDVHSLINSLREYLQFKRYFIVIDDLWDPPAWDVIRCVFPENNVRSRVIVTTRSLSLGGVCCYPDQRIFAMKPLSHQDSRKLFLTRIFGSEDGCPSKYQEVSDGILKRCGGLPLAIVTISSLLAVQRMRFKEEWEYICNSLNSHFATNPTLEGMKEILNLSYRHLPRHLRACFLYLGMYPEDRVISRHSLVKQWVAEGFVSNFRGLDAEDVADSYFIELVNRNLIQPHPHGYSDKVFSCKVHDMMIDLIISKCIEENFVSFMDDLRLVNTGLPYKVRRLSILSRGCEDDTTTPVGVSGLSQIRSLAVFRGFQNVPVLTGEIHAPPLSEFMFLRVLQLDLFSDSRTPEVKIKDLTGISQLLHLRYLRVMPKDRSNYSIMLPTKIVGLQKLEVLEIIDAAVETIPSDISLLPRLSHLHIPRLPLPDLIYGNMKSLRTLGHVVVLHSSLENIKSLGDLTNLRYLSLNINNSQRHREIAPEEAMHALQSSIQKMGYLKRLYLTRLTRTGGDFVVSSLSPPLHIEQLGLIGCLLPRDPKLFSDLRSLYWLSISVGSLCKDDLHLIGELPSLTSFILQVTAPKEKIVIDGAGFPRLLSFDFSCSKLSYLIFEAGAMPKLGNLFLRMRAEEKWDGTRPVGLQQQQLCSRPKVSFICSYKDLGSLQLERADVMKSSSSNATPASVIIE